MALSLALAFTIGFVFFPDRWAWIVLTVVVVAVGNAGRADVLFKGIQRVLGAAAGTVVALLGLTVPTIGGPNLPTVILLLVDRVHRACSCGRSATSGGRCSSRSR